MQGHGTEQVIFDPTLVIFIEELFHLLFSKSLRFRPYGREVFPDDRQNRVPRYPGLIPGIGRFFLL